MRPGLDQQKVLEAAIAVADRVGYDRLTWALVAEATGVKPPSLYNHVESLEALRGLMALEGVRRLYGVLAATSGLFERGQAYVRFARANPSLYQASIRAPGPAETALAEEATRVVSLLFSSLSSYGYSPSLAVHAVRVFRSGLHGFVSIEASGGFGLPESLDATLEALLTVLIAGLGQLKEQEEKR